MEGKTWRRDFGVASGEGLVNTIRWPLNSPKTLETPKKERKLVVVTGDEIGREGVQETLEADH